jgi:antitoxin CcdA
MSTVQDREINRMSTKEFTYDETARRKPVNLTINQDLLASARKYKLNLSKVLEDSLLRELKTRWQNEWLDENKEAISDYNKRIARHGVFSDGIRRF